MDLNTLLDKNQNHLDFWESLEQIADIDKDGKITKTEWVSVYFLGHLQVKHNQHKSICTVWRKYI